MIRELSYITQIYKTEELKMQIKHIKKIIKPFSETKANCTKNRSDSFCISNQNYVFSNILTEWLKENSINTKKSTKDKYSRLINQHIIPELGSYHLSDLSPEIVNSFIEKKIRTGRLDKEGGLSPSYVRTMSIIIKSATEYAIKNNFCDPIHFNIYKPKPEKKVYSILSENSFNQFSEYLSAKICPVNLGILLSMYAGLRIGEVCALKWSDIDIDAKFLHITSTITRISNTNESSATKTILKIDNTKTIAGTRNIPIVSNLIKPLEEFVTHKSYFLLTGTESFMSPRTYENKYHKALNDCGIKPVNYHILRHTFATRCIQKGVDIKTLSEILGHSDITTTLKIYVHTSPEQKLAEIEKIAF